jgi:hypothetical protein
VSSGCEYRRISGNLIPLSHLNCVQDTRDRCVCYVLCDTWFLKDHLELDVCNGFLISQSEVP